jgi:hypothetical protein
MQDRCTVCAKCTCLGNHIGRNRWYSYVTSVKWKLILVHLEIVLISTQDRCTVCPKCTMNVGQMEILFAPFADSVNLDAR